MRGADTQLGGSGKTVRSQWRCRAAIAKYGIHVHTYLYIDIAIYMYHGQVELTNPLHNKYYRRVEFARVHVACLWYFIFILDSPRSRCTTCAP